MLRSVLLLLFLAALAGCAADLRADLEREYGFFRYEQEKYRRGELEKLYEAERRRSDELTERILRLRREIERKEKEVQSLRKRLEGTGKGQ